MTLALAAALLLAWRTPGAPHAPLLRPRTRPSPACLDGDEPPPEPKPQLSVSEALAAADAKLDEARRAQVGSSWQELGRPPECAIRYLNALPPRNDGAPRL